MDREFESDGTHGITNSWYRYAPRTSQPGPSPAAPNKPAALVTASGYNRAPEVGLSPLTGCHEFTSSHVQCHDIVSIQLLYAYNDMYYDIATAGLLYLLARVE